MEQLIIILLMLFAGSTQGMKPASPGQRVTQGERHVYEIMRYGDEHLRNWRINGGRDETIYAEATWINDPLSAVIQISDRLPESNAPLDEFYVSANSIRR